MDSRRASPGITLGADNHGRLFAKSRRDRNVNKVKPGVLAAQYRLNVNATKTSDFSKILRPKKHDMVQLVKDEVELCGVLNDPPKEEKVVKEIKVLNLDDSDFSDEEDELDKYFLDESCQREEMCQKMYNEACKSMHIIPMKHFHKALVSDELKVVGVTLRPKDIKACAIALCRDCEVEKLTFEGNDLRSVGAIYLSDVVAGNSYLIELTITENNIGNKGAEAICNALKTNNYLRKLDLSGNNLTENDAVHFKEMLDENHALRELYLRHNKFQERGGEIFAEGLAVNDFLKVLDLSWNHLRLRGATAIGRALQQNHHLEKLNISWNGFHLTGAATISYALTINTTLIELDMSCNRLTDKCVHCLIKGLEKNSTLQTIRIGHNQMYPTSLMDLLECIDKTLSSGVQLLDLEDQCVYDKFETLYNEMKKKKKPFEVIYGYVWDTQREGISQSDFSEDDLDLLDENPITILFEYARLQNFRLLDMFVILDKDKSGSLSKKEFKEGLEQVLIPMKDRSLNSLIKKMDKDNDGEIDFSELILAQKDHKQKLKEFMRADIPFEQSEIGRVDRKLRLIMSKRHLMKKKKVTSDINLLKVLELVKTDAEKSDKTEEKTTDEEDYIKRRERISSVADIMNFIPILQRNALLEQAEGPREKEEEEEET